MAIGFHPFRAMRAATNALFTYDAVQNKQRRRPPVSTRQSEDKVLDVTDRGTLQATARLNRRNQCLLAWIIRQHLDFVTKFTFQSLTEDETFNRRLESLIKWRSLARNWDIAGRHNLHSFVRLIEASRVVDGDIGVALIKGGWLQGIESDRIAVPSKGGLPEEYKDWAFTHGVRVDQTGKATHYCVSRREETGTTNRAGGQTLVFDRMIPAEELRLIGYYDRFDQVRGISPLASALNHLTDLYESIEFQLAKAKKHSLLGTFIKRQVTSDTDGWEYTDADTGESPTGDTTEYNYDLKWGVKIEGAPGDELDLIESKTPSTEWQDFAQLETRISMLCLDIPYSFFDGSGVSYSQHRADWNRYMQSVENSRNALREFLNDVVMWDVGRWIKTTRSDGQRMLTLPKGMQLYDLDFEWVAAGVPWIDKAKEVNADMLAVSAGFQSRDDVVRRTSGKRFNDVISMLGKEEKAAIAASATIAIGQPGQITTRDEEGTLGTGDADDDGSTGQDDDE